MAIDIAKTIVEKYDERDVLECIDGFLRTAERYLKPQDGPYGEHNFGVAYSQVKDARQLLVALRNRKFPSDSNITL